MRVHVPACPVCDNELRKGWLLIFFKPYFKCDMCGWKMSIKEVRTRGGLEAIRRQLEREAIRRSRKKSRKPRKRRR